jgi:hypothetical protein
MSQAPIAIFKIPTEIPQVMPARAVKPQGSAAR